MTLTTLARPAPPAAAARPGGMRRGTDRFRFGTWLVDPSANRLERQGEVRQMEPRTMDVLVVLCRADGRIVHADELLEQCWGSTLHGDNPVHKNVALLRRLLGDSAGTPVFIETIRKRGYRTVAPVGAAKDNLGQLPSWEDGSPFRGLLPFDAAHAQVFHGREEATRKLIDAARLQVEHGLALLLLLGPSGSGKTSLVQAGLFPAMAATPATSPPGTPALLASTTIDLADQGEQTLACALAGALLDLEWDERRVFDNENAVALGHRLDSACDGVAAQMQGALAGLRPGARFGIFIDRFEALFNHHRVTETQRAAFLRTLEQLARSGSCLVVLACRNDYYPHIARCQLLLAAKANGGHVDLAPPGYGEIAQMIRKPAAAARLTFGTDPLTHASLDDVLCEQAFASPDALPLLQYCLHELYRLRTAQDELGFAAFEALGGLEGAIGRRAEQVVLALGEAQHAALPHIMSLVTVLSAADEQVTSQRAPWSALRDEAARQAVAALVDARLFVSDLAGALPVFGIAHEAILRRWPRMSDWIGAHRDALRARGRLAQQAARWRADGRASDLLLPRGKLLDEAKALQQAGLWSLEPAERDLIRLSDRRARQFAWLRLGIFAVVAGLAILNAVLALNATRARHNAEARRAEVEGLVDFMLGDFADRLRPLGKLDLLESISDKALQYLHGSRQDELGPAGYTLRAKALQVIGEVSRSRGNAAQAIDALDKANTILARQHALYPRDVAVLNNLGNNAYWVGQLHKDHNDLAAAAAAWQRYLQYADQLRQLEPDRVDWWIEQSYAHNNLGSLAMARGTPALAVREFAASIALKQRALVRMPDSKMLAAELAESYSWLASARQSLGQLQAAEGLYLQALGLLRQLRERFPDEPMWANRHSRALQNRAVLSLALGNDAAALEDFSSARTLLAQVARQDHDNSTWQVELANLDLDLLKVMARRMPPLALLPRLREVQARLAASVRLNPKNAQWARSEALAGARLAALRLAAGQVGPARHDIDAALARLQPLLAANPSSLQLRLALVEALLTHGAVHRAENHPHQAQAACRQAGDILRPDAATYDFQILDAWGRAALCGHDAQGADVSWKRLQQIGYRDSTYRQAISGL